MAVTWLIWLLDETFTHSTLLPETWRKSLDFEIKVADLFVSINQPCETGTSQWWRILYSIIVDTKLVERLWKLFYIWLSSMFWNIDYLVKYVNTKYHVFGLSCWVSLVFNERS